MFKFKKAVSKSSKKVPVTKSVEELKIYKNMDKYVTKKIKESIKYGLRYVEIEVVMLEADSISIWDYADSMDLLDKILTDYKEDLMEEGYEVREGISTLVISWEHGMNKDA